MRKRRDRYRRREEHPELALAFLYIFTLFITAIGWDYLFGEHVRIGFTILIISVFVVLVWAVQPRDHYGRRIRGFDIKGDR